MTKDEGLSVREAVEWCGDEITNREATRLRRLSLPETTKAGEPRVDATKSAASTVQVPSVGGVIAEPHEAKSAS